MVRFHFERLVVSSLIRFKSPETPVHLDSPDTPYIGRKAFYPKPNENLNDGQGTNPNNSATNNDSLRNDSTETPINKNHHRQRNQFNGNDKEYRQNGQRRHDRHHG